MTDSSIQLSDFPVPFPDGVEIRETEDKGRGLYITKAINAGETIISAVPFAHALSWKYMSSRCSACYAEGAPLMRCTRCKTVMYCDSECQKRDWPLHKKECAALQRCAKDPNWKGGFQDHDSEGAEVGEPTGVPGEVTRCLGRILGKKAKPMDPEMQAFDQLHFHMTEEIQDPLTMNYLSQATLLMRYLGLDDYDDLLIYNLPLPAMKNLTRVVSRFATNSFTIKTPSHGHSGDDSSALGIAVSPALSMINHSCRPNAMLECPLTSPRDTEPILKITALQEIEAGQEVFVSYVNTLEPREERQKKLQGLYGFECKCRACEEGDNMIVD